MSTTASEAVATILKAGTDTGYSEQTMPATHKALLELAARLDEIKDLVTPQAAPAFSLPVAARVAAFAAGIGDDETALKLSAAPEPPHPLDGDVDAQPGGSLPAADRLPQELLNAAALYEIDVDHRWSLERLQAEIDARKPKLAAAAAAGTTEGGSTA
jgi:hypothetical protein